jgi:hypothetical protein
MMILSFLIIQPVVSSELPMTTNTDCCSKDADCSGKERNPCTQSACNPLRACVYGNYFVVEGMVLAFSNSVSHKANIPVLDDKRTFTALSECWHPPRAAFG